MLAMFSFLVKLHRLQFFISYWHCYVMGFNKRTKTSMSGSIYDIITNLGFTTETSGHLFYAKEFQFSTENKHFNYVH